MTKLWQKSLKIKHGFQKFLCGRIVWQKWFFGRKIFLLGWFFDHFFQKWWIKKWPQPKKLVKWKISFFMPVNHVQKFLISVHSRIIIFPFCIGGSIHLQSPCSIFYLVNCYKLSMAQKSKINYLSGQKNCECFFFSKKWFETYNALR